MQNKSFVIKRPTAMWKRRDFIRTHASNDDDGVSDGSDHYRMVNIHWQRHVEEKVWKRKKGKKILRKYNLPLIKEIKPNEKWNWRWTVALSENVVRDVALFETEKWQIRSEHRCSVWLDFDNGAIDAGEEMVIWNERYAMVQFTIQTHLFAQTCYLIVPITSKWLYAVERAYLIGTNCTILVNCYYTSTVQVRLCERCAVTILVWLYSVWGFDNCFSRLFYYAIGWLFASTNLLSKT